MIKFSTILFFCLFVLISASTVRAEACKKQRNVSSITFITDVSLSYKDLSRDLPLKRGEPCTSKNVDESIEILRQRNIFEVVEFLEVLDGENIRAQFTLIPYLILSNVVFQGNKRIPSMELRRGLGIRPGEQLREPQIEQIRERIKKAYNDAGFFNAEISIDLVAENTAPLTRVEVSIKEGRPRRIKELVIREGDEERLQGIFDDIRSYVNGKIVTRESLREVRRFALTAFRERGFYQARISVILEDTEEANRQNVVIQVNPRNRVDFSISGNSYFNNSNILAPLRLEQRSVPLGVTTLDSLCRETIERYQEAGFLRVAVTCERLEEEDKDYGGKRDIFSIKIDEGEYYRVRSVSFSGNTILSEKALEGMINVVPRSRIGVLFGGQRAPTNELLKADAVRIQEAYARLGLDAVRVRTFVDIDDERLTVKVRYRIRERGTNKIDKLAFVIDYADARDEEVVARLTEWEQKFPLKQFETSAVERELDSLREILFSLGFPEPSISYDLLKEDSALLISIVLGPRITVGKIILEGNFYTHDRIIFREMLLKEGDAWNPVRVDESKQGLFSLGVFRSVVIEPKDQVFKGRVQDMVVRVLERETGSLQGAVEFSTQDGVRLQMQAGQRNLFGDARSLVLALDGYFRGTDDPLEAARTRLAFGSPRFLGTPLDYGLEMFYQTTLQQNDSFKLDRIGVSNSVRYPFLESSRFNLSHTAYSERLFDVASNNILSDRDIGTTMYSVFRAAVELDKRDDAFNPTTGYRAELGAGYFPKWAGSEVEMFEVTAQETTYLPLSSTLTYVFNLRGALRETVGSDDVVPLGSRYFIGGRDTLRGYTRFQVGPRALDNGLVVGGDTFGVFSQELRYLFSNSVVGLVFVDFGQAFLRSEVTQNIDRKNQLKDFRVSPGLGMQYITPIGPLSAELGFATDREFGERFGRFLVSIGSAF